MYLAFLSLLAVIAELLVFEIYYQNIATIIFLKNVKEMCLGDKLYLDYYRILQYSGPKGKEKNS